jgi:hypothetical protein
MGKNETTARIKELEGSLKQYQTHWHSQQECIALLETKQELAASASMDRTKESDVSIQTLKKQIQELQGQLAQLDSKCQSQANIIALLEHAVNDDGEEDEDDTDMMMHDMDMEEEGETKDDYHQGEIVNDYLEELKSVKQQMATKSVCREETIAWLMEENELKDAKLEILEGMVQSLMAEQRNSIALPQRASRWRDKIEASGLKGKLEERASRWRGKLEASAGLKGKLRSRRSEEEKTVDDHSAAPHKMLVHNHVPNRRVWINPSTRATLPPVVSPSK